MTERIIGVAARCTDRGVYSLLAPARHGQILRLVGACYPDDPNAALSCEQGFVTDRARFVTREEAREIVRLDMHENGIIAARTHYPALMDHTKPGVVRMFSPQPSAHATQIFSEDLW